MKRQTQHTELAPVTVLTLLLGRKGKIYEAYIARFTFTGFKIAKLGGWL